MRDLQDKIQIKSSILKEENPTKATYLSVIGVLLSGTFRSMDLDFKSSNLKPSSKTTENTSLVFALVAEALGNDILSAQEIRALKSAIETLVRTETFQPLLKATIGLLEGYLEGEDVEKQPTNQPNFDMK